MGQQADVARTELSEEREIYELRLVLSVLACRVIHEWCVSSYMLHVRAMRL